MPGARAKFAGALFSLFRFSSRSSGSSSHDVVKVSAAIITAYGFPDILVNNAGYATYHTFGQEELQELERLISVNFTGAVRVTPCIRISKWIIQDSRDDYHAPGHRAARSGRI
jgi:NAD(P)-dependent dehydrogenase (short-subunit alcohol dehydrogenase family)